MIDFDFKVSSAKNWLNSQIFETGTARESKINGYSTGSNVSTQLDHKINMVIWKRGRDKSTWYQHGWKTEL